MEIKMLLCNCKNNEGIEQQLKAAVERILKRADEGPQAAATS